MSEIADHVLPNQEKRNNETFENIEKRQPTQINFIFQDESKISIPLSIVKNYPESILSLTYQSQNNYLEEERVYYVDSPSLSLAKVIEYLDNSLDLDSIPLNEIIDIYKTLKYFFRYESIEKQLKIEDFLVNSFQVFLKENNCEIPYDFKNENYEYLYDYTQKREFYIDGLLSEERNIIFQQYSSLFEFFNFVKVTINFDFSEDIPYESIYPSNLHSIFPKLETYTIQVYYYPQVQYIRITPSSFHYSYFYQEYILLYYKENLLDIYKQYMEKHPEISSYRFNKESIRLSPSNNHGNTNKKEEEEKYKEIIHINIVEDLTNTQKERPDLYIQSLSDYSREYNEEQMKLQKTNDTIKENHKLVSFQFSYIDENEVRDRTHPIFRPSNKYKNDDILAYILKLPVCKQLKSINNLIYPGYQFQLNIPPLLKALRDKIFDSIQIFNILSYIHDESYSEYKQLFIDIITSHIFPNVTTLIIDDTYSRSTLKLYADMLPLITEEHFPSLHIYDIHSFIRFLYNNYTDDMDFIDFLFPISLLSIVDIILLEDKNESLSFILNEESVNNIIHANKKPSFCIQSNMLISYHDKIAKQLYDLGLLNINTIILDFDYMSSCFTHNSQYKLSKYPFKYLTVEMNECIDEYEDDLLYIFKNMNYTLIKEIQISITQSQFNSISLINKYFLIYCNSNYETVNSLMITYEDNDGIPIESTNQSEFSDDVLTLYYHFFSLFSTNIQILNISVPLMSTYLLENYHLFILWTNIQTLTLSFCNNPLNNILNYIFTIFKNQKLSRIQSLTINTYYKTFTDISPIYVFIESFKDTSYIKLQDFHEFHININGKSFPTGMFSLFIVIDVL
ncbi:hypothetical protein WA158_000027 [Blastocystis sp. Blastoise]